MNILIIGFLGSGKSSIGKRLARNLDYKFVELDDVVLDYTGYTNIQDVEKKRKTLWKECELQVSKDLSLDDNMVIACGGGFINNELNMDYFKDHNPKVAVIYLSAKIETLARRSLEKAKLKGKNITAETIQAAIAKIFSLRDTLYRNSADIVIQTDNTETDAITIALIEQIKKLG